jgi:hypothetical protein
MRTNQPIYVPAQINPAADELLRRDWIEANIAGGGSPEVIRDSVAPAEPHSYKVWIDVSTTPPTVREWTGAAWQTVQADPSAHDHDTRYAAIAHVGSRDGHPLADGANSLAGLISGASQAKLDGLRYAVTRQNNTYTGYTASLTAGWNTLTDPTIAMPVLDAAPAGTRWVLDVLGSLRVTPPAAGTLMGGVLMPSETPAGIHSSSYLTTYTWASLFMARVGVPVEDPTVAFSVRFAVHTGSVGAGSYSFPSPNLTIFTKAYLEAV